MEGQPMGRRHSNPIMDTRVYEVEMADGSLREYHANIIALNLYSQVDPEGRTYRILDEITDHKSDKTAITKEDGWLVTKSGQKVRK